MEIFEILNGRQKRLFAYLSLFLAISFFFASIFFGLDFTDSFYHLNQALHPAGDWHLYSFLGSSLIIKGIIESLGPEIIVLRLTNSFLLLLSFLFPFLILKPKLSGNKFLFYLACGLVLFLPFNVNILGYDTLSIFFLSLIFSISIDHLKTPGFFKLLFLSLLCAAAVLIRLPNILCIPIILLWFLIFRKSFPNTLLYRWQAVILLLLSILGIAVAYASYYRSWNSFMSASANTNSHVITELLQNYLRDGIQLSFFLSFILISYFLFLIIRGRITKFFTYLLLIITMLIFMSYYLLPGKYVFSYSLFIFAVVLSYTGIQIVHWKKQTALQFQIFVLYFLFIFINLFGSNTGLLKGYSLFVLFPFIFSLGKWAGKNYWTLLLLLLIPFSFLNKVYGIYEDKNLFFLSSVPGHEWLSPVHTSELRAHYLDAIDAGLEELRNKDIKVYFYGDKSHIFHYLYPQSLVLSDSFHQPVDDPASKAKIEKMLQGRDDFAIFIIHSYPERVVVPGSSWDLEFQKMGLDRRKNGPLTYYQKILNH